MSQLVIMKVLGMTYELLGAKEGTKTIAKLEEGGGRDARPYA